MNKVNSGDPLKIPAETFNTFIDAAQDFKVRTRGFTQKATAQAPQRTIIPVKNMSGADRQRFDVLEISQPQFDINSDAGKERPMAMGVKPRGPSEKSPYSWSRPRWARLPGPASPA